MFKAAPILWRWASVCCSVCMTFSHPPSSSIPSSSFVFVPWQVSHILPEHRAKRLLCIAPCGCLLICHLFSLHLASWLYPMTLFQPHSFYFITSLASPKPEKIFFQDLQKSSLSLLFYSGMKPRPEQISLLVHSFFSVSSLFSSPSASVQFCHYWGIKKCLLLHPDGLWKYQKINKYILNPCQQQTNTEAVGISACEWLSEFAR